MTEQPARPTAEELADMLWRQFFPDAGITPPPTVQRPDHDTHLLALANGQREAAEQRSRALEAAPRTLIERIDTVHSDEAYKAVWFMAQLHAGPYAGPTYEPALTAARAALAPPEGAA